jgi:Protein of unknown function (DUF3558)
VIRRHAIQLVVVVVTASLSAMACTHEPGRPRPASPSEQTPTSGPSTAVSTTVASIKTLDLCALVTPADFPVRPDPQFEPRKHEEHDTCGWSVQQANPFDVVSVIVQRVPTPFKDYKPLLSSPNGRFVQISGRDAWVGSLTESTKHVECIAVFGAADGAISMAITDETRRGVDPCMTITELAGLVISRTPPPPDR